MKKLLILLLVAFAPLSFVACSTPPSARVQQVQTLKAVGHSAESAVATAGQLYKDGLITAAQLKQVTDFFDLKFLPTYRLAVTAVSANLDMQAPDQIIALSAQLAALVLSFQKP